MYDDEIFADRFRYQMIMFKVRLLAELSRILLAHMAYEISFAKMTAKSAEFTIV